MNKIKISHINPTDIKGGASLSAYRLHVALFEHPDVDSVLFVNKKYSDDHTVIKFSNPVLWQIERMLNRIGYITGLQYFFSVNWIPLLFNKRFRETDIFIIRNIHGGYLPLWFPNVLNWFAPIIWRLPDMWPFTSHCVYCNNDRDWKRDIRNACSKNNYPAVLLDFPRLLLGVKNFFYNRSRLYIAAPSHWMVDNISDSILKKFPLSYIPIGVDPDRFQLTSRNKKISLLYAPGDISDVRKGVKIFPEILTILDKFLIEQNINVDVYWAGVDDINLPIYRNVNNIFMGKLMEVEMAKILASCHIHALPTLADNLPNTIVEALACGTPTVCFDVGGCKDAIISGITGYLAKPLDLQDFCKGLMNFIVASDQEKIKSDCRAFFEKNFTMEKQVNLYVQLIKKILSEKHI